MCGILGFVNEIYGPILHSSDDFKDALDSFIHRGPDSQGIWFNNNFNVGLAHNRLAIQDLTASGAQPMKSSSGRYTIVFNGELYNHKEIRADIENRKDIIWQGTSDTESLIESIEEFGIDLTLKKVIGMFAFGLWDEFQSKLYLARDRTGEKPLHYFHDQDGIVFSSQADTMLHFPWVSTKISHSSLQEYLHFGFVPDQSCIFSGVKKLKPGSFICFDQKSNVIKENRYWDKYSNQRNANATEKNNSKNEIADFDTLLTEVTLSQCISDVPFGTFLSGGIDSSLITAILQKNLDKRIDTFTIGFEQEKYNEANHAREISNYIGTNHHEKIVQQSDILESIDHLANIFDEPFADASVIPTLLLSKFAKEHVVVALSGDGGDEIFYGYNRYLFAQKYFRNIQKMPNWSNKLVSDIIKKVADFSAEKGKLEGDTLLKIHKICSILNSNDKTSYYFNLMKEEIPKNLLNAEMINTQNYINENDNEFYHNNNLNIVEIMSFLDRDFYLPGDILTKVDRSSMVYSLETRAPFLDKRIIEFSNSIDYSEKIFRTETKHILRKTLNKYIPKEMFDRPKQGFGAPVGYWMRKDLRDSVEDAFSEKNLKKHSFFNVSKLRLMWDEFLKGNNRYTHLIWRIFVFQNWYNVKFKNNVLVQ